MKKFIGILVVAIVLYIGLYVLLSALGEYETTSVFKGNVQWQPKGVTMRRVKPLGGDPKTEANFGGYVFLPLLYVDRTIWHRDKSLGDHLLDKTKDAFESDD